MQKTSQNKMKVSVLFITVSAMLIATEIILERVLAIEAGGGTSRYSPAFIARAVSAVILGPIGTGITSLSSDIIGSLFKFGSVNPLISGVALLRGVIFGLFLYNKRTLFRIIGAVTITEVFCGLILMSYILSPMYGMKVSEVLAIRLPQCIIMIAVQIPVIMLLEKYLFGRLKKIMVNYGFVYRNGKNYTKQTED